MDTGLNIINIEFSRSPVIINVNNTRQGYALLSTLKLAGFLCLQFSKYLTAIKFYERAYAI